ncbi:c-type cytochrome [Aliiruegeria lutimaris]|uniref:Cytochrome C oxidase, cbb3-type, subunit III n=1 Tax=Aliiruegeria lutimaris TaxID=571298 RepID=A0A1G9QSL0_9RHOB|nr:c-type cytochrome [Aliiruegeria lutimaris]SDM14008.1 Cytochrome C oxidase, cbb3-type, subunit III [Aliiruegeria lutimaris]
MKMIILLAVLAISMGTSALSEEEPYIEAGKRMAEANCANCHNIMAGGAFKLYPPSFQAIAIYMDPQVMRMKIMFPDHAVLMPQFHTYMFAENIDNIVGYILSLDQ